MEGVTRESVKRLLDLQRVDSAIDRLRHRKADLSEQRALDEILTQRAEVEAARAEKQVATDAVVREQSRLEGELAVLEEKITHESHRLYSGDISNPKELANIQAELDGLRRRKAHLEDQELEVMDQREVIEAERGSLQVQLDDLDRRAAELTAARDSASVEIERDLRANEEERRGLVQEFPEELLELYDDLRAKKNGVGAAPLEGGVCRGCGVALSPFAIDAIKRSEDLARCENCRRILVLV